MYEPEKKFLASVEDSSDETNFRQPVSSEQAGDLPRKFPNVPKDYIDYLVEIGAGNFRESRFKVYEDLMNLDDFGLSGVYEISDSVLFFGDNFSGDFAGFDLENKRDEVVELWHESGEIVPTGKTFREYIREQMEFDSGKRSWWKIWQ